jgi:hypothetical protein
VRAEQAPVPKKKNPRAGTGRSWSCNDFRGSLGSVSKSTMSDLYASHDELKASREAEFCKAIPKNAAQRQSFRRATQLNGYIK